MFVVNLFEEGTDVSLSGQLYMNDSYQGNYSKSSPYLVRFAGSLSTGTATLTEWDLNFENKYRLWYSSSRARDFAAFTDNNWTLYNFPTTNDYESGTLPYTNMTYEVNPDPYPIEEYPSWRYVGIDRDVGNQSKITWTKLSDADDRYAIRFIGSIPMIAPATKNIGVGLYEVDENYSQTGSTYSRDSENRGTTKQRNRFVVDRQEAYIRVKFVCTNPLYYQEIQKYINK
jgi:hypothetical protein